MWTNGMNCMMSPSYVHMKFLKYDPFWHQIENVFHIQLENNPIGWRSKVHIMPWITTSQLPLIATLKWCREKCVTKMLWNWRHKTWLVNRYNVSYTINTLFHNYQCVAKPSKNCLKTKGHKKMSRLWHNDIVDNIIYYHLIFILISCENPQSSTFFPSW